MYHGVINVYKEAGFTSHDVVARLRGICKQKKIGHTGTLDPDAVGVLPVCLGNATRLCDMLTDRTKEYVASFRLGIVTDTQDLSGKVLESHTPDRDPQSVRQAVASFVGDQLQIPPMYAALKVDGKRLYELAREGKTVERKARQITIYELELLKEEHPDYTMRVCCSKGTYIRTLCHDIGQKLGCGGVMTHLLRSRVGEFRAEDAYRLSEIQSFAEAGRLQEILVPTENMFSQFMTLKVKDSGLKALQNGNKLFSSQVVWEKEPAEGQELRVYGKDGQFFGIYRYDAEEKLFCPVKMFFE